MYLADVLPADQSKNKKPPEKDGKNNKGGKNRKQSAKGEKSELPVQPLVEPNLHEDPDLPISGPGDIFEWAAYFIQEQYDRMRKDETHQLQKRVMDSFELIKEL